MKFQRILFFMLMFIMALSACNPIAPKAEDNKNPDNDPCLSDEWGCAVIHPGQTIKIGASAPISGPAANLGIDNRNAGTLAVADAGEIFGFSFELQMEDDEGSSESGAAVANKLVSDPTVVALLGPLFTGPAAAAMPIYETAGIPMMSASATAGFLTQEGSRVFNRIPFIDPIQGKAAADFIYTQLKATRIAIIHNSEDYGRGLADAVKAEFESLGGTITSVEGITPGEADYTPILTTIAAQNPEVLYFGGYPQEAAVLTNQLKSVNLQETIFFGCDGSYGTDYLAQAGENAEGTIHANIRMPKESDLKNSFEKAYIETYGIAPVTLSPYTYNSYDATLILTNAVKSVAFLGDNGSLYIPRGALVDAVRNTTEYIGIGTYTCNEVGECNTEGPAFERVINGEWVVIN